MAKILIIDDQAPIRRVLRDILENETYQVEDVGSGMEALQLIKEQEFDAIFCDIKMDGMDGIETLEQLEQTDMQPIFNLNGQRVSRPQKGVFISGGKKVIVK